jgi:ABC-type transporter Mla MlaB component
VFKITTNNENPEFTTVSLCGRFTREYVPEVEKALSSAATRRRKLALDLAQVTLVDRAAIVFLCAARSKNIAIENVPLYVGLWMDQEECQGPLQSN